MKTKFPVFCVLIWMLAASTLASQGEASILVGEAESKPGEYVDIPISLENNPGIVSMSLHVTYNQEVLSLQQVQDGKLLGAAVYHNPDLEIYPYVLNWANDTAKENYTASGVIVTLRFKVKDNAPSGKSPVEVRYNPEMDEILDKDLQTVFFSIQNGFVNITGVSADSGNSSSNTGSTGQSHESGTSGRATSDGKSEDKGGTSQKRFQIAFRSGGGGGSMESIQVSDGTEWTLPSCSFSAPSGQRFRVWEIGGELYNPGKNVVIRKDTIITALWETVPSPTGQPAYQNPFSDVRSSDYFYEAVLWAAEKNITTGKTSSTFAPGDNCTRAQTVTFLWRVAGSPEPAFLSSQFSDVDRDSYYYKAVLWALENGITQGTTKSTFSPDRNVTRCQAITFLYRSSHETSLTSALTFQDVSPNAYYYDAVNWALNAGVTKGFTEKIFGPDQNCNRGQIVTFLYRHYSD